MDPPAPRASWAKLALPAERDFPGVLEYKATRGIAVIKDRLELRATAEGRVSLGIAGPLVCAVATALKAVLVSEVHQAMLENQGSRGILV